MRTFFCKPLFNQHHPLRVFFNLIEVFAMIDFWNKLDRALQIIYANFLLIQKEGREAAPWIHPVLEDERTSLHVVLEYSGDLSAIEALGFETSQDEGEGNANGFVDLNK